MDMLVTAPIFCCCSPFSMAWLAKLGERLNRKKTLSADMMETPLNRCLTTLDLALLGIGHMLGAGIFVLTGTVVKDIAGPGTVLSYFFAGIAAMLAALCYAEFGARVPKAGSAYTYTYVTIGEFIAFLIGKPTACMLYVRILSSCAYYGAAYVALTRETTIYYT